MHGARDVVAVADVAREARGVTAARIDFADGLGRGLAGKIDDGHARTFVGEPDRGRAADAAPRARNERHFSLETRFSGHGARGYAAGRVRKSAG